MDEVEIRNHQGQGREENGNDTDNDLGWRGILVASALRLR